MPDPVPQADLNVVGPTAAAAAAPMVVSLASVADKTYDPTQDREVVRGKIAMTLIWSLVGIVGASMLIALLAFVGCHQQNACSAEINDLKPLRAIVEVVLTPLVGLVGAVTGFYFGDKSGSTKSGG